MSPEAGAEADYYRELAEKVRELARQSPLPDVRQDLLELAGRFDEMAAQAERPRSGPTGGLPQDDA